MFKYNEASFEEIIKLPTKKHEPQLLAITYCTLITVELILKRTINSSGGHDIPGMLINSSRLHPKFQTELTTLSRQFRNILQSIYVQGKSNTSQLAPGESYPYIRYFRHTSDWSSPSHDEDELFSLLNKAKEIRAFLKKNIR